VAVNEEPAAGSRHYALSMDPSGLKRLFALIAADLSAACIDVFCVRQADENLVHVQIETVEFEFPFGQEHCRYSKPNDSRARETCLVCLGILTILQRIEGLCLAEAGRATEERKAVLLVLANRLLATRTRLQSTVIENSA
jgi:hypothetical protein